jgi:UDP-glucose 4-epimerase
MLWPPGANRPLLPLLQFVKGDIQCADLVRFVLESEDIDTIMHFAAQVSPGVQSLPIPLAAVAQHTRHNMQQSPYQLTGSEARCTQ